MNTLRFYRHIRYKIWLNGFYLRTDFSIQMNNVFCFRMIDLNLIMRENKKLNEIFVTIEQTRANMYQNVFQQPVKLGIMRPEIFNGEYTSLIERIRIFSDAWVSSSEIYDKDKTPLEIIEKYSRLFQNQLFPYLSEKGIKEFLNLRK